MGKPPGWGLCGQSVMAHQGPAAGTAEIPNLKTLHF